MAAGTAARATTGEEAAMQAVAAAMRDAAATASEHAAKLKESTGEAGISALRAFRGWRILALTYWRTAPSTPRCLSPGHSPRRTRSCEGFETGVGRPSTNWKTARHSRPICADGH